MSCSATAWSRITARTRRRALRGLGALILFLIVAVACTAPTAESRLRDARERLRDTVVRGRTTQDQITALFGKPARVFPATGGEIWIYAIPQTGHHFYILFDGRIVANYTMDE